MPPALRGEDEDEEQSSNRSPKLSSSTTVGDSNSSSTPRYEHSDNPFSQSVDYSIPPSAYDGAPSQYNTADAPTHDILLPPDDRPEHALLSHGGQASDLPGYPGSNSTGALGAGDEMHYRENEDIGPMTASQQPDSARQEQQPLWESASSTIMRVPPAVMDKGLVHNSGVLYDVHLSPVSSETSSASARGPGLEPSASSASVVASDGTLRRFTDEDFEAAMPKWSNAPGSAALFDPNGMQWILWGRVEDVLTPEAAKIKLAGRGGNSSLQGSADSHGLQAPLIESIPEPEWSLEQDFKTVVRSITSGVAAASSGQNSRTVAPFLGPIYLHHDWPNDQHYLTARIPSTLNRELLTALKASRRGNPPPGISGDAAYLETIKVLIRILANASRDDTRHLPLASNTIRHKLVYDDTIEQILFACGMSKTTMADGQEALQASSVNQNQALRNLIEVLVWFEHTKPSSSLNLETAKVGFNVNFQRVTSEDFPQRFMNWLPQLHEHDNYTRFDSDANILQRACAALGVTEKTADYLVEKAYLVNKARMPLQAQDFLLSLGVIHMTQRVASASIAALIREEQRNGMWTYEDLAHGYRMLDLDPVRAIQNKSYDDDSVQAAFCNNRNYHLEEGDIVKARNAQEALRIIAKSRGDPSSLVALAEEKLSMTVSQAYKVFNASESVKDDETILSAYVMHSFDCSEDKQRLQILHEALGLLAEHLDSPKLRRVRDTGSTDPDAGLDGGNDGGGAGGWEGMGQADVPAGLNNIGNTCYLNSVLQYFFALKPLRDRVLSDGKSARERQRQVSERRVGGRTLTAYEIERSSRFVAQLCQLFETMITSPAAAVTPERDLAYLALVSARVEELEKEASMSAVMETAAGGAPPEQAAAEPLPASKQARTDESPGMDLDKKAEMKEAEATAASRRLSLSTGTESTHDHVDDPTVKEADGADSIDAGVARQPPPLPPRPKFDSNAPTPRADRRNSLMQLGAQQDVSECLDNVLFQVEVALGETTAKVAAEEIGKLFEGRTRQTVERVSGEPSHSEEDNAAAHVKEEIFTILPVEVLEEPGRDIYDGLDGFFDAEVLPASSTKQGSLSGDKPSESSGSVRRTVTLLEPPPILQIQLQRVQFDRTRGVAYKSQAHLQAAEDLYMDRYLDAEVPVAATGSSAEDVERERQDRATKRSKAMTLRTEMNALRDKVALLAKEVSPDVALPAGDLLAKTAGALGALGKLPGVSDQGEGVAADVVVDPQLAKSLHDESALVGKEVHACNQRIAELKRQTETLWDQGSNRLRYRLVSVFMHRGEAAVGHYFLNQRKVKLQGDGGLDDGVAINGSHGSEWFKYNDAAVTPVSIDEVLHDKTGATPYVLCYVRDDLMSTQGAQDAGAAAKTGLFETVRRELGGSLETPQGRDTSMDVDAGAQNDGGGHTQGMDTSGNVAID